MPQVGSPTLAIGRRINPYEYRCEPCSRPLVMEAFYFLYSPSPLVRRHQRSWAPVAPQKAEVCACYIWATRDRPPCALEVSGEKSRDARSATPAPWTGGKPKLERVMNWIRKGLGIGETEIAREPSRPCNPHFYAVFTQVHNTL
jgi:hypothetical protein